MDYQEKFADRLAELRIRKGVSARDMSLSLGQSPGYINNIENRKNLPSMTVFFYICDYLNITPQEFFDFESKDPVQRRELEACADKLNDAQREHITAIIKDLAK